MKKRERMTEPEIRQVMRLAARTMECAFDAVEIQKPRFVLVVFNDPKVTQYISNCQRKDIIASMRETAARLEAKEDLAR